VRWGLLGWQPAGVPVGQRGKDRSASVTSLDPKMPSHRFPIPARWPRSGAGLPPWAKFARATGFYRGNRMIAAAWAAIPSPRPVNPSFSVVVALTEMHPGETPRRAASRSRIAWA
jgi:hypothetical protein